DILYGEINTPLTFVETILGIIPENMFSNPELKWLDPACGCGNFMIILYFKLMKGLESSIINIEERRDHIIKNMIYMIEIQEKNADLLRRIFGTNANIICADFLNYGTEYSYNITID
ncbi:MAG: DNA methyltransferase, partial [Pirellulaceae bacterium]